MTGTCPYCGSVLWPGGCVNWACAACRRSAVKVHEEVSHPPSYSSEIDTLKGEIARLEKTLSVAEARNEELRLDFERLAQRAEEERLIYNDEILLLEAELRDWEEWRNVRRLYGQRKSDAR